jgi:hypothetical protein
MNTPNKTPTNPPSETPETASASTSSPTYILVSGVERHHIAPRTFQIPPQSARESLRSGDQVKLWFHLLDDWPDERMWVIVKDVRPGCYVGVLNNHPFTDCVRFGERVQFQPDHVLDIDRKKRFCWRCWLRSLLHSVVGLVRWRRIGAYLPR